MNKFTDIAEKYISTIQNGIFGIIPEATKDYEDVVCFHFQSKKWLQTRNFSDLYVGQGPCFIIKKDCRIVPYGSAWSSEMALANLRKFITIETEMRKKNAEFDAFENNYYLSYGDDV